MVRITSALFPMDSTLCIIKPDAMRLGYKDAICHMIHLFGFNVIAEGRFKFTRVRAELFYRAHAKMPYFETLIRFMISRSVHVMVLVRDNCCRSFRALIGPKDSNRARREAPQTSEGRCTYRQEFSEMYSTSTTYPLNVLNLHVGNKVSSYQNEMIDHQKIRALYGTDGRMNAIHGSDTPREAEAEIKFFFPTVILEPYPNAKEAADYFKANVQPLLLKGLTALAKAKPASETYGAVWKITSESGSIFHPVNLKSTFNQRWLATWLHDHNPRLPLVCICVDMEDDKSKEKPIMEFPFF